MLIRLRMRKIYGLNHSSAMTLPPVWLEHSGLKKGDYLELTIGDTWELIVRKHEESSKREESNG